MIDKKQYKKDFDKYLKDRYIFTGCNSKDEKMYAYIILSHEFNREIGWYVQLFTIEHIFQQFLQDIRGVLNQMRYEDL